MNVKNIMEFQALGGLCSGCGVCAAQCIHISMKESSEGGFRPQVDDDCTKCKKCLGVCPFYFETDSTRNFSKNIDSHYIGSYTKCYKGYSKIFRKTSASGGLATAYLAHLLKHNIVDEVICISYRSEEKNFFQYSIVNNPEDLINHSGSAYYPISIDSILQEVLRDNKSCAIVGLPCVIKGIRKTMARNKKANTNIKLLIGLACGGVQSKNLIDYLAYKGGYAPDKVTKVKFREHDEKVSCTSYPARLTFDDGHEFLSYMNSGEKGNLESSFGFAYLNKYFTLKACLLCTDALAEIADVVFMDAWLPEYEGETLGRSLVVARSHLACKIMQEICSDQQNVISECSAEDVIKAQRRVNLIQNKKEESYFRNIWMQKKTKFDKECINKIPFTRKIWLTIKTFRQVRSINKAQQKWADVVNKNCSFEDWEKTARKYAIFK